MSEREKILRYYRSSGDGDLAARLVDAADSAQRNHKFKVTEFLDPYGYSIAETVAAHYPNLELTSSGGYPGAERVKAIFVNKDFRGTPEIDAEALAVKWDERYYELTHRDVLGALMGLGIKREIVGDIIMCGQGCQIIIDTSLAGFISREFIAIGPAAVAVSPLNLADIAPRVEKIKEIKTTVSALRLDVIAAAGFGTSRTTMSDEIGLGKLKVNWQDAKNSAQSIKVGDIISMRGRGRVEVAEVLGQTKKGRISVLLKRFM